VLLYGPGIGGTFGRVAGMLARGCAVRCCALWTTGAGAGTGGTCTPRPSPSPLASGSLWASGLTKGSVFRYSESQLLREHTPNAIEVHSESLCHDSRRDPPRHVP